MYEHCNKRHTMGRIILIFTSLQVVNIFCQKESSTIENILFRKESEFNSSVLKSKAIKGESENVIKKCENEIIGTVEPNSVSKVRSNTTTSYGEIYGGPTRCTGEYETVVSLRCALHIHRCGGSLINEWFVLSAADCYNSRLGQYSVAAGINRYGEHKIESPVIEVHIHKMYQKGNHLHNIALFELGIPIRQNHYIEYARLPPGRIGFLQTGSEVCMKGWRPPKDFDKSKHDNLRYVSSRLIDFDECTKYWPSIWRDKDSIFCALAKEELSMCIGDIGSSITYSGMQIGILSFGRQEVIGCSLPYPEVYTKIDYYLDWINRTMGINARKRRGTEANDANSDF